MPTSATNIENRGSVLIVDESPDYLLQIKRIFQEISPDIKVIRYNPSTEGVPVDGLDLTMHHVLLLDSQLAQYACFDALQDAEQKDLPYTVLMSGVNSGSELDNLDLPGVSELLLKNSLSARSIRGILERADDHKQLTDTRTPYVASFYTDHKARPGNCPIDLPFTDAQVLNGEASLDNGNYLIKRLIGVGGMSAAYLAKRESDGKQVAIKTLTTSSFNDDRVIDRFVTEFQIARNVDHPNVVKIYDQRFSDEMVFIVMEYLSGDALKTRAKNSLEPDIAVKYAMDIAASLMGIHEVGIVHRDIKPGNFHFNDKNQLVLLDFGISKSIAMDHGITKHGEAIGTPFYMSPEQLTADTVDSRSDLFSLGIILYMMLTGRHPFGSRSPEAMLNTKVFDNPRPLPFQLFGLENIVDKLLKKDPDERYQAAEEIYDDLAVFQLKHSKYVQLQQDE